MSTARFHHPEDVQDSIESLQREHGGSRPFIYWLALAVTAAAVASLPLVKVDMSVGAPGQVRPALERLPVQPAVAGKIVELSVADNRPVRKGDVLLVIDTASLDARLNQNENQRAENDQALADLGHLLGHPALAPAAAAADRFTQLERGDYAAVLPARLVTGQYLRQHSVLLSEIRRLLSLRQRTAQDLARAEALHGKGLLAEAAFDEQRYALESVEREFDLALQQTLSRWQNDRIERERRRIDLASEAKQLHELRELHVVRAPVDGTAIGFLGLHPGQFVPAEQRLGEISPGGGLQADVYIGPRDIGFVRTGQPVKLQVDAFPYTEWGMLRGRVRDISQDFVQVGQVPAFRTVVDLDDTRLTSASGLTVELRRGMTVNARFVLERRTLFSVLYGKLSDSLDPRARSFLR